MRSMSSWASACRATRARWAWPAKSMPDIQYSLDDPDEYKGETIVVIGAPATPRSRTPSPGARNTVHIVNRKN